MVFNRISKNTLDFKELIKNHTIDFKNENGKSLLSIYFNGDITNNMINDSKNVTDVNSQILNDPVESIVIGRKFGGERMVYKCFTFFSFLQQKWREYQTYFYYMFIKINYDFDIIPPSNLNRIYFAAHSSNVLLELSFQFYRLAYLKNQYFIKYSFLKTALLDKRYNTNCFEYNLDYKHANFNMKSDCITHCYQRRMNEIVNHGVIESYAPSHYLLRKQDCNYKYYTMDKELQSTKEDSDKIAIYFEHDHMPDISITHIPEITFISLVCNLGGLIGMWLSISMMVVFEEFYRIMMFIKRNNMKNNPAFIMVNNRISNINNIFVKKRSRTIDQSRINN